MINDKTSPLQKLIFSRDRRKTRILLRIVLEELGAEIAEDCSSQDLYYILLKECEFKKISQSELASHIEFQCKNSLLKIEDFSWIDSPRSCYFTWLKINKTDPIWPKDSLYICSEKNSLSSYFEDIIDIFDELPLSLNEKEDKLTSIKVEFRDEIQFKHKLIRKIINSEDVEQLNWIFEYLVNRCGLIQYVSKPEERKELIGFILAHIDLWAISPAEKGSPPEKISHAEKALALNKAYNAMHSKKFKSKAPEDKGANLWLSTEDNKKISKLAELLKQDRKEIIHRLIAQEYSKIIGY